MTEFQSLDKKNFELLFKSHYKELCHFAMQYVKDIDTSKEIVQEMFTGVWQKRETIDLSRAVKTYLFSSVRNRCINHLRDHKKFDSGMIELEDHLHDRLYHPSDKLVEAEIRERISKAISELPGKCREIFILSRNERLKYQEIADQLDLSVKTVETQMSKALQHMRVRLAEFINL